MGFFHDIFNNFIDFAYRQVEAAYELVVWMVTWIYDSLWAIIEWFLDFFFGEEGIFWYIFDFVIGMGDWFLSFFPDLREIVIQYQEAFFYAMVMVGRADRILPVTEAFVLFGIYLAFVFAVVIVRWVIKFIPGTGN